MPITLRDTRLRKVLPFKPLVDGEVRLFVCGPTVYDYSHLGHARTYVFFDFLARFLTMSGYRVEYVQNITDIDDKIIARANELMREPLDLAREYEQLYLEDMAALRVTSVSRYARAHDFISQIISQVKRMSERGYAYRAVDGWYFELAKFPAYGELSGRTAPQPGDAVSRIDTGVGKRGVGDFALWKFARPGEPSWPSELGAGRPGWHIEDTAITEALLGPQYDIHGGAVDLIFPHHEAEIAQIESVTGKHPMVNCWLHTGLLQVDGAKMGKSEGNYITIRQALESTSAEVLRFAFLSKHYRSVIDFSQRSIQDASGAVSRLEAFRRKATADPSSATADAMVDGVRKTFFAYLQNDLDTPGAFGELFRFVRESNKAGLPPGPQTSEFLEEIDSLFAIFPAAVDVTSRVDGSWITDRLEARSKLRAEGKYSAADKIRDELEQAGVIVEDGKAGSTWSWRR